jgi:hypothetical protein
MSSEVETSREATGELGYRLKAWVAASTLLGMTVMKMPI